MTTNTQNDKRHKLSWDLTLHESFRWLPRQGRPSSVLEWLSQTTVKIIAWLPIYIAIVVTIILLVQLYLLSIL